LPSISKLAKTLFSVRFASALATNDKLLTKHVREVSQRLKQSDKNSEHKNPYKMAIFPVGIPYSLQKPKNPYCRDIAIFASGNIDPDGHIRNSTVQLPRHKTTLPAPEVT